MFARNHFKWLQITNLVSAQVLAHYDPNNLQIKLACDASSSGIAIVVSQIQPGGIEKPISFDSRVLNPADKVWKLLVLFKV